MIQTGLDYRSLYIVIYLEFEICNLGFKRRFQMTKDL